MARLSVEAYEKAGLDIAGYLEPEVTSDDTYPSYIKAEVEEKIERLQDLQGFDTATFGFITDMHFAAQFKHSHVIRLRRTLNAYRKISSAAHSDMLVLGGDHITNGCKHYVKNCFRALREELNGIRYFPLSGNHDNNEIWDVEFIHHAPAENHLTNQELYTLFFNGTPALGAVYPAQNRGLYYYLDDSHQKIRYVFLDSHDVPDVLDENGSMVYYRQNAYGYSQAQMDWLLNEALNTDEGYAVVIFQHSPPRDRIACLRDILRARKEGGSLQMETGEEALKCVIDADFADYHACEIVGVFTGHTHADSVTYWDGIPYVSTRNSVMYTHTAPDRVDGEKSELAFDIVTLNRKTREISMLRVGYGEDRYLTW